MAGSITNFVGLSRSALAGCTIAMYWQNNFADTGHMAGAHARTQCCIDYFANNIFGMSPAANIAKNIVLFIARGTIISQKGVWLLAHCFCGQNLW